MNNLFELHPFSKSLLRYVLGMKNSPFVRYMCDIEEALIELSPKYSKFNKTLTEKEFLWICLVDKGMQPETVATRIMAFYPKYKPEDYAKVLNCYGLSGNNPFISNHN